MTTTTFDRPEPTARPALPAAIGRAWRTLVRAWRLFVRVVARVLIYLTEDPRRARAAAAGVGVSVVVGIGIGLAVGLLVSEAVIGVMAGIRREMT